MARSKSELKARVTELEEEVAEYKAAELRDDHVMRCHATPIELQKASETICSQAKEIRYDIFWNFNS